ncbi:Response regulator receiver domain-containing protein [Pseudobacteriovorax antillogorgiicola]|uniref:Response regulator receiver domain-containing protein n=1 Tax=Pseudobacteriovorax antillogorgiicola TaxID=1513793 RepID=A0A1Y6BB03_9BACT|nr:response regulator receiver domain-containing protein [Pseudobacteriovorax antillogorgiicola]SMF02180.1 Response regulator receiver domain-containing protein [Pseudobacteriovorax antillogorgiicola]
MIAAILKKRGADVISVSSVKEAFEAFSHGKFDILISDIAMPGATGYDLIKDIRNLPKSKGSDIPAIALTAYASVQDRQEALAAGFNNHIAKPIEPNDLILCIIKELELV